MVSVCLGLIFALAYHKDPFWDFCYFQLYINDLSNDVNNKSKLFADDISLSSVVHDIDASANYIYHDLEKRSHQTGSRKKLFLST